MEKRQPVKTIKVGYWCDCCNQGEMEHTGMALMSYPPLYKHVCNHCGFTQNYTDVKYPHFEYQYEETE